MRFAGWCFSIPKRGGRTCDSGTSDQWRRPAGAWPEMREPLSALAGRRFDVAVIGAGANGASAAQHLAAAGYSVLLVDKGDFASGSSSRSSRLLHCGLRYLAPGKSLWEFVAHPGRFATACRMASAAMDCRAQLVRTTPERTRAMT